ncbi:MAG: hypothetical protein FJ399_05710 [Verrucomicrobia bacterium]|nr:hypothetical protein [Verrucomicrobiota bacterium]
MSASPAPDAVAGPGPLAVPTFHCLGLYWSPPEGGPEKAVLVRFRAQGASAWREGLSMRYNPIPGTDEDLTDYRGSLVDLAPGTTYEVQLTLAGTSTTARLTATTWSEDFPVGQTVRVGSRDQPLEITESGSPGAYRLYDGRGATIDVRHAHNACITIDAAYVIVRGFTLKGAGRPSRPDSRPIGAIAINGGHHIVIEDCDISDWGSLNPKTGFGYNYDSAIYSRAAGLRQLVVQRCRLHDPTCDGSTWSEPVYPTHSAGPQYISLFNAGGEEWMTGHQYIFHNTAFGPREWLPTGGLGGTRIVKHVTSRNNILQVRTPQQHSLSNHRANLDNSYDYDLFNGQIPPGVETRGIRGEPTYVERAGFDPATQTGRFQLAPHSPGAGAGETLPNFSGAFSGKAPDIGAHQRGAPPMQFGVRTR